MPDEIKEIKKHTPRKVVIKGWNDRLKQIPLSVRLYVDFEFEWYTANIREKRGHSLREEKQARRYARDKVKFVMKTVKDWTEDGMPPEYKQKKK